jgi:hypothetical protein
MADPPRTIEQIQEETKRVELETALINAETKLAAAQRARVQQNEPADTRLEDLQGAKDIAAARQALAEAEAKTKIAEEVGEVKSTTYSGAIDLKEKTGTVEAMLLAIKAVGVAAEKIATEVDLKLKAGVLVVPGRGFESFQRLVSYRFRKGLVKQSLCTALESKAPPCGTEGEGPPLAGTAATPALVSAGLDAVGKLLSFFKTDFTIGGVDATVEETAALYAVAGALAAKSKKPRLPQTYMPQAQQAALSGLLNELVILADLRGKVQERFVNDTAHLAELEAEKDANKKAGAATDIARLRASVARLKAAADTFDGFASGLTASEGTSGTIPLVALVNEIAVDSLLREADSQIMLVRVEATGGGYMTKKNLWTGLGGMPLYHMGGAALSYALLDGPGGDLLAAGTKSIHGGFVKSSKLGDTLK